MKIFADNRTARALSLIAGGALALTVIPSSVFAQADPCGGISLAGGKVVSGRPLRALEKLPAEEQACVDAVGKAIGGRSAVRSVTVAVRLPDAQRAAGAGPKIGALYQRALVAGGVPEARVSIVSPAAARGEQGTVQISFTEKRAKRSVAVVEAVGGTVSAGADRSKLEPIDRGATLPADTYISTGAGSTAWIGLADGSRLRLAENSLLLVGRLHLNDALKRVVRLQLVSGELEADVRSEGKGAVFDVSTRFGTAGVRGTRFRLVANESGTRLETLEGKVELAAGEGKAAATVEAGQGATVAGDGAAGAVQTLLTAPAVTGPLKGSATPATRMVWQAVDGARGYVVELARDAEFTFGVRRYRSDGAEMAVEAALPAGKWFWRVAAVNEQAFVGTTSKVYAFEFEPKR